MASGKQRDQEDRDRDNRDRADRDESLSMKITLKLPPAVWAVIGGAGTSVVITYLSTR
jgi:hypothetical protein